MELVVDTVAQELKAMAAVAAALEHLDTDTRQRVLRWAADRFALAMEMTSQAQQPHAQAASMAAVATAADDQSLAIDSLAEIFPHRPQRVDLGDDFDVREAADSELAAQPIEAVLRSFAADFQRFADAWNGAAA